MAVFISRPDSEFVENEINNVSSDIIRITEDKLRLKLAAYENSISHCFEWIGALGIVVAILLSFLTSDFKDRFGLKAETWKAVFCILLVAAIFYFVYTLFKFFGRKTIDELVSDLKK